MENFRSGNLLGEEVFLEELSGEIFPNGIFPRGIFLRGCFLMERVSLGGEFSGENFLRAQCYILSEFSGIHCI